MVLVLAVVLPGLLGSVSCPPGERPGEDDVCAAVPCPAGQLFVGDRCVPVHQSMKDHLARCAAGDAEWCRGIGVKRYSELAGLVDLVRLRPCTTPGSPACVAYATELVAREFPAPGWALGLHLLTAGCERRAARACSALAVELREQHAGMLPNERPVKALEAVCASGALDACLALTDHFRLPEYEAEAQRYRERACALKSAESCLLAAYGAGDVADVARQRRLFAAACALGDANGCYGAGSIDLRAGLSARAETWFRRLCPQALEKPPRKAANDCGLALLLGGGTPGPAPAPVPPHACIPLWELRCSGKDPAACDRLLGFQQECRARCGPPPGGTPTHCDPTLRHFPNQPSVVGECPCGQVKVPACTPGRDALDNLGEVLAGCAGAEVVLGRWQADVLVNSEGDILRVFAARSAVGVPVEAKVISCAQTRLAVWRAGRALGSLPSWSYGAVKQTVHARPSRRTPR